MVRLSILKRSFPILLLFAVLCTICICTYYDRLLKEKRYGKLYSEIKCSHLFRGDKQEQEKASVLAELYNKKLTSAETVIERARDCKSFILSRKYTPRKVSQEERDFPIAYGLLVYKDLDLTERLLRAIYRPQNYYCIHVDVKSSHSFRRALLSIASCFENVFLSSISHDIRWGRVSVLFAEIQCMKELLLRHKKWKYFINLTGHEFPLKTNLEIVRILKAYNGSNDIHSDVGPIQSQRFSNWTSYSWESFHKQLPQKKSTPPFGIKLAKGEAHLVVSRDFVNYVITSPVAKKFLKWIEDVRVPDEFYFQSLNINQQLGVPGSRNGNHGTHSMARYKHWVYGRKEYCGGRVIRGICIFGVRDLPWLTSAPQLFANKFSLDDEAITYRCMEEWLNNKEKSKNVRLKTDFYRNLPFVKNSRTLRS